MAIVSSCRKIVVNSRSRAQPPFLITKVLIASTLEKQQSARLRKAGIMLSQHGPHELGYNSATRDFIKSNDGLIRSKSTKQSEVQIIFCNSKI